MENQRIVKWMKIALIAQLAFNVNQFQNYINERNRKEDQAHMENVIDEIECKYRLAINNNAENKRVHEILRKYYIEDELKNKDKEQLNHLANRINDNFKYYQHILRNKDNKNAQDYDDLEVKVYKNIENQEQRIDAQEYEVYIDINSCKYFRVKHLDYKFLKFNRKECERAYQQLRKINENANMRELKNNE